MKKTKKYCDYCGEQGHLTTTCKELKADKQKVVDQSIKNRIKTHNVIVKESYLAFRDYCGKSVKWFDDGYLRPELILCVVHVPC